MKISFIVAMAENRVIGTENRLPWRISEDLKFFKRKTSGHAMIMGRKTFDSIGRALPNRMSIVLTRQESIVFQSSDPSAPVHRASSVDDALELARRWGKDEVFVIGGEEIYRLFMPRVDRIYLTLVHKEVEGDAVFPQWHSDEFAEISREPHLDSETPFTFICLERRAT